MYAPLEQQEDKATAENLSIQAKSIPTLFPNPATDMLNLKFEEDWMGQEIQAEIVGVDGKVYLNKQIIPGEAGSEENDISTLPKGLYLIRLSTPEGYTTLRFIKQ